LPATNKNDHFKGSDTAEKSSWGGAPIAIRKAEKKRKKEKRIGLS